MHIKLLAGHRQRILRIPIIPPLSPRGENMWITHVRSLWEYVRIDYKPAVSLMNLVTENTWAPLQNGFVPQRKVVSKIREGAKVKKTFDRAQTPYERLLDATKLRPTKICA